MIRLKMVITSAVLWEFFVFNRLCPRELEPVGADPYQ
jgi:hypothetical protein